MATEPRGPDMGEDALVTADDAALGIGEDNAPAPPPAAQGFDVNALMAHPAFAAAVEAVVAARYGAQAAAANAGPDWDRLMEKFDRQFNAMNDQKPGYIKPWTADEKEARDRGLADLKAILADYRAKGVWPTYLLGEDFYGESQNGLKIHKAGATIKTRIFPADSFKPLDEAAVHAYEAYKRWVGEVHDIGDLIATAMANARGAPAPEVSRGGPKLAEPEVMEVEAERRDMTPARQMGTLVPEGRSGSPKTLSGVPLGPTYIED